jgi:glycine oxidase
VTSAPNDFDLLVVGGGVVGLSIAYELSSRGWHIGVLDRQNFGRESSWAGAGIIPPGSGYSHHHPLASLAMFGHELLHEWSRRLEGETGRDNGWRINGAIYLTWNLREQQRTEVDETVHTWREHRIESLPLTRSELEDLEPELRHCELLARSGPDQTVGWYVPSEGQLRNPRHLQALAAACRLRGVEHMPYRAARSFVRRGTRIDRVVTDQGELTVGQICLTAGCWTGQLAAELGLQLPIKPIRGQILMLHDPAGLPPFSRNVHWNDRYAVSRGDGRVLIGATVEDVGFCHETTAAGIDDLRHFARRIGLGSLPMEASWAGLRPATSDGLPLIGRLPGTANAWIAAGHFRAGLQMSASTAVVLADLMEGRPPALDLTAFRVERFLQ